MKTSYPLVTICVPTYNNAGYLVQSLSSILGQSYRHIEVLVGDDASTDTTAQVVQSFTDERLHYFRNPVNLGQFENVNTLVKRAKGKYVAVYHSDDLYTPQIVEKEAAFLEANPRAGAVFALDWRIDSQGQMLGETQLLPGATPRVCLSLKEVLAVLLRYKNRLLRGPTFMGRAQIFEQVGYFCEDYDIAGDLEMWLRILTVYPIGILDEPLMYYRHSSTQVSSRYNYLRTFEEHFFTILDCYLPQAGDLSAVDSEGMAEYAFHRLDDTTFRAANAVLRGDTALARRLLDHPFPWTSLYPLRRRKLRVLLLRLLMAVGLRSGMQRLLCMFLTWSEYEGSLKR
ncbi:glycosyltransferase family 2 protein [Anthocerotibacter panamensis]|uniref:glycosyltransferase family 2 protein n=1 Tax=Anthocerotibacter panamensis TaxID=2857077 RepID=UPI001C406FAA|nr:glycosyltransferase [Anthocerotibacter panamensis]